MIVFRPFKGEVILARITSATQDGINRQPPINPLTPSHPADHITVVRTDFFDDIFVPFNELPDEAVL
jgi:DNA-directed RNA polymerase III subunit RPC8